MIQRHQKQHELEPDFRGPVGDATAQHLMAASGASHGHAPGVASCPPVEHAGHYQALHALNSQQVEAGAQMAGHFYYQLNASHEQAGGALYAPAAYQPQQESLYAPMGGYASSQHQVQDLNHADAFAAIASEQQPSFANPQADHNASYPLER